MVRNKNINKNNKSKNFILYIFSFYLTNLIFVAFLIYYFL